MNSIRISSVLTILVICGFYTVKAQNSASANDTDTTVLQHYGFDKHKLFAGGSLNLGYGAGTVSSFAIGILPEVGYSFKEWIDAGLAFNINYYSGSEDTYNQIPGYKATSYGAGIFVRVHPFEGYFIQAQPEIDNYSIRETLTGYLPAKYFHTSTSYLVGIGWGRRIIGESSFFTTIMVDLGNEKNTPYKDAQGNLLPVIRTGINFYF